MRRVPIFVFCLNKTRHELFLDRAVNALCSDHLCILEGRKHCFKPTGRGQAIVVGEHQQMATRLLSAPVTRRGRPGIYLVDKPGRGESAHHVRRCVSRTVVDYQYLGQMERGLPAERLEARSDTVGAVVGRNDDGDKNRSGQGCPGDAQF